MLLESVHKRWLVIYINLDQGFKIISRCDINSAFIFKCKILHPFFWNGVDLADGWTTLLVTKMRISGLTIWWSSTFYCAVSSFTAVETKVILYVAFALLRGKSPATTSAASAMSKASMALHSSINLGVFSQNFLNVCISSGASEPLSRSCKGMPILVKFLCFLH